MLITTPNEIIALMPTARWSKPELLFGYLDEEERVTLEPLLGAQLLQHILGEYDRLNHTYGDTTVMTVRPTGKLKDVSTGKTLDVTDRIEAIKQGRIADKHTAYEIELGDIEADDMQTLRLIHICQRIEFYKMLSHKAGLLTVSFNEGGGMNTVDAEGYDPADEKAKERVAKDAYMSAGRAIDDLLLFLEADAKSDRLFTELWQEADAFYLHKDLLFQTARVLNEYLPIKGERMAYVELVRDIRFCQNTYLKPRIGAKLLKAVVDYANGGGTETQENQESPENPGTTASEPDTAALEELLSLLRTALAFYVEARRVSLEPVKDKLARRDSMTDAQQAMAMACEYVEENLDALGDAVVNTPIYNAMREKQAQEEHDKACACAAEEHRRKAVCEQNKRKLFTGFPHTHRRPETK